MIFSIGQLKIDYEMIKELFPNEKGILIATVLYCGFKEIILLLENILVIKNEKQGNKPE